MNPGLHAHIKEINIEGQGRKEHEPIPNYIIKRFAELIYEYEYDIPGKDGRTTRYKTGEERSTTGDSVAGCFLQPLV